MSSSSALAASSYLKHTRGILRYKRVGDADDAPLQTFQGWLSKIIITNEGISFSQNSPDKSATCTIFFAFGQFSVPETRMLPHDAVIAFAVLGSPSVQFEGASTTVSMPLAENASRFSQVELTCHWPYFKPKTDKFQVPAKIKALTSGRVSTKPETLEGSFKSKAIRESLIESRPSASLAAQSQLTPAEPKEGTIEMEIAELQAKKKEAEEQCLASQWNTGVSADNLIKQVEKDAKEQMARLRDRAEEEMKSIEARVQQLRESL